MCERSSGLQFPRRRSVRRALPVCKNCETIRWHNTCTFEEKRALDFSTVARSDGLSRRLVSKS